MSMQRSIVDVTEQNLQLNYENKFQIEYPKAFECAIGPKHVNVVECRVFNNTTWQEDISFSLHADFAHEADNRYDCYVSLANSN